MPWGASLPLPSDKNIVVKKMFFESTIHRPARGDFSVLRSFQRMCLTSICFLTCGCCYTQCFFFFVFSFFLSPAHSGPENAFMFSHLRANCFLSEEMWRLVAMRKCCRLYHDDISPINVRSHTFTTCPIRRWTDGDGGAVTGERAASNILIQWLLVKFSTRERQSDGSWLRSISEASINAVFNVP